MKSALFPALMLACWPALSQASLMTFDPDDFAAGTNLSYAHPQVSLSTQTGGAVYAGPIGALPPAMTSTGPFGERVFASEPAGDSGWIALPYDALFLDYFDASAWAAEFGSILMLDFLLPVDWFSVMTLELWPDAGPGSDPFMAVVYDSLGKKIGEIREAAPSGDLGCHPSPDDYCYNFWDTGFAHADIAKVVMFGDSEPTIIDKLRFRLAPVRVPEPGSLGLLLLGLSATAVGRLARRR